MSFGNCGRSISLPPGRAARSPARPIPTSRPNNSSAQQAKAARRCVPGDLHEVPRWGYCPPPMRRSISPSQRTSIGLSPTASVAARPGIRAAKLSFGSISMIPRRSRGVAGVSLASTRKEKLAGRYLPGQSDPGLIVVGEIEIAGDLPDGVFPGLSAKPNSSPNSRCGGSWRWSTHRPRSLPIRQRQS